MDRAQLVQLLFNSLPTADRQECAHVINSLQDVDCAQSVDVVARWRVVAEDQTN